MAPFASSSISCLNACFVAISLALLALVALSSFFINDIRTFGPFSAIHILSIVSLISLIHIVRSARSGRIKSHKYTIQGLYFGGLVGAGIFTFLPGRLMHQTFFGKPEFYLSEISNAWMIPMSGALLIGAILFWRARQMP